MGKLIGTGRDPRMAKGADYDVHDDDVQAHADAGLGKPVDPTSGHDEIHRAGARIVEYDTDQDAVIGRSPETRGGHVNRTSARIDRTRLGGGLESAQGDDPDDVSAPAAAPSGDDKLTGEDLKARAAELDIEGRSSMTAAELRDAVARAEAGSE